MPTVVVAVDGSELAYRAAETARDLLRPAHAVVVCVVRSYVALPAYYAAAPELAGLATIPLEDDETHHKLAGFEAETDDAWAHRAAEEAAAVLGDAETRIVHGDPGEMICRVADEVDADVIVLGQTGKGRLARFFLGSVSHHVLHHAHRPVLVVPEEDRTADRHHRPGT